MGCFIISHGLHIRYRQSTLYCGRVIFFEFIRCAHWPYFRLNKCRGHNSQYCGCDALRSARASHLVHDADRVWRTRRRDAIPSQVSVRRGRVSDGIASRIAQAASPTSRGGREAEVTGLGGSDGDGSDAARRNDCTAHPPCDVPFMVVAATPQAARAALPRMRSAGRSSRDARPRGFRHRASRAR